MSPNQAAIVRRTHARLLARRSELAASFRLNLLRIDPTLRSLVLTPDGQHDLQPVQWLEAVVSLLGSPVRLHESLRRLGLRLDRQVTALQISNVGRACLQTLRDCLGSDWNVETEQAWSAFHQRVRLSLLSALVTRAQAEALEAA